MSLVPLPIDESTPRDGTVIWGYHRTHGMARVVWETGEECLKRNPKWTSTAEELGSSWVLAADRDVEMDPEPTHWLPESAIQEPPHDDQ